jgi:class 3 adenylate cyclase
MRVCPSCGRVAPEEDRFCGRCGTALGSGPGGERRALVSIVFADLVGSTTLGERLDAEILRGVQARYFSVCASALQAHGAQIEKFIGDAAMAVFGIPRAREEDALRACRAALELVAGVESLSNDLERELGVRLQVRVGVHSGEVVAGDPSRGQALVTGDVVNTAARLEQAAAPGEVLIGRLTRQLAGAAIHAEPIPAIPAKGKAEPVPAYRLRSQRLVTTHTEGVLVGRQEDLSRLQQAFDRVSQAPHAECALVVGEAGIGKSRLVAELVSTTPGARAITGHCPPYGEGVAYWPVREFVDELAGDSEHALAELVGGAQTADALLRAIGRRSGTPDHAATLPAVLSLLRAAAADRPLIAVLEDLHWAAPAMLDLIEAATGPLMDAPVLLVATSRGDVPGRLAGATRLRLRPLDERAAIQLLAARGTPPGKRQALVEVAGGNPMFLEQLQAAGDDAADRLPPTLRALLAARIDRLEPADREVLDAAAVAGREFWPAGLTPLLDGVPPGDVPLRLALLEQAELIAAGRADARMEPDLRLSGIFGTAGRFAFRHALIQEAAYASLPKARAAELHERFAAVLRAERSDHNLPVVAWHLSQAQQLRAELRPKTAG